MLKKNIKMPINRITPSGSIPESRMEEFKMKSYSIKGTAGRKEILEILRESKDGFQVKIIRDRSGWMEEKKEFMPRELFDTCIRTEYLKPINTGI